MSNETNPQENPMNFESWTPLVEAAIEFAEQYDEQYRPAIVQALLSTRATPVRGSGVQKNKPEQRTQEISVTPISHGGLASLAKEIDVDPRALSRIVDVSDDGAVQILARIDGRSKAKRAYQYAALYCFIREKALGQLDTDIEELRSLCEQHGCYDAPNFQRNFRNNDYLLEIGNRGTRVGKRYRLSSEGEDAARRILKELLS